MTEAHPAPEPVEAAGEETDVAVVGMAGRFPRAAGTDELWENICAGRSGLTHFDDEELRAAGVPESMLRDPAYVRAAPVLDGIELFDAPFFGISAIEAQLLDPQQRLFLEHSWHALEDAGYDPARVDGTVGVFAGGAWSTYVQHNLAPAGAGARWGELAVGLANDKDSLATRVAHALDLTGPAYGVQSYCSTSLVAVCAAASSLAAHECDVALAGGVAITVPHRVGYLYQPGSISPPDAECRAFDAAGLGAPLGNGVGVVTLTRLADAVANGDRIYAVIRGWAVNNDGGHKVGFTAPGVRGQSAVIAEALSSAGLTPADIDYVEAHGTGTMLGDAAEISAMQQVFRGNGCRIGSVKSNIGHLDRAAGVTGLIKTALALTHEQIPPTRNLSTPNPQLTGGDASLDVVTALTPWPSRPDRPRRAGVSAFGIGGTNAHVVLEEAPRRPPPSVDTRPQVLVWSARTSEAADEATERLGARLTEHPAAGGIDGTVADIAHTLQEGRRGFAVRRALVADSVAEAAAAIRAGRVLGASSSGGRGVAFLIAGTGEQYPGMAHDLARSEPVFAEALERCRRYLIDRLDGLDPLTAMLDRGRGGDGPGERGLAELLGRQADSGRDEDALATLALQPAVFAVEYALARLLESWGIAPGLVVGYSLGEYVAACLAGVLSLEDALALVARRAQLIASCPPGAMAAVPLGVEDLEPRLSAWGVDIAAITGPRLTVLSGSGEAMAAVRDELAADGTAARLLATSHAFHSRMLRPAAAVLEDWIRTSVTLRPPALPVVSNVTGTFLTADRATDPGYWIEHMCGPVRFGDCLTTLLNAGDHAVVELGPGRSLGAMLCGHPGCPPARYGSVVPTLPAAAEPRSANSVLADSVARLWLAGVDVDWRGRRGGRHAAKVRLPGYPFQRERYWIEPPERPAPRAAAATAPTDTGPTTAHTVAPHGGADGGADPATVPVELLTPVWRADATAPPDALAADSFPARVILVGGPSELVTAVVAGLSANDVPVTVATADDTSGAVGGPGGPAGTAVVDLRLLEARSDECHGPSGPVLPVARLVDRWAAAGAGELVVVTRGGQAVIPGERPDPGHAAAAALPVVAGQEYVGLRCRTVDLDPAGHTTGDSRALVAELVGGPDRTASATVVAYRSATRHRRCFEPVPPATAAPAGIRPGATYLITGAFGDVGRLLARHLAAAGAGGLVLVSRQASEADPLVTALVDNGVVVRVAAVDVTDTRAVADLLTGLATEGVTVDGVVHAAALSTPDGFRPLRDLDPPIVAGHFGAKVDGASALAAAFESLPEPPRFCLVFSSTSAVLGGLAFGSYAAANAALIAMALRHDGTRGTRWVAPAWDTWATTLDRLDENAHPGVGTAMRQHAMSTAQALAAFDDVLAGAPPAPVVAAGGLDDRLSPVPAAAPTRPPGSRFPRPDLPQPYSPPVSAIESDLAEIWSDVLGVEPVGSRDNFFDLGGNSLLALQMLALVKDRLQAAVASVDLFEAPTVQALAGIIGSRGAGQVPARVVLPPPREVPAPGSATARSRANASDGDTDRRVAVIGMAGRFPGAPDVTRFWRNLCERVESVRFFSRDELLAAGVAPALADDPAYVPARPVLDDVRGFDARFFGMSPRMAALTDPQQRVFLEVCWEALEQAGYADPRGRGGRVGVYGGANLSTYLLRMPPEVLDGTEVSTYEVIMGNEKDALTTTVSYLFDLRGPSVAVQTFCSTSLVATHLAVQALRNGECEMAIAGGVSIRVPQHVGHLYGPGGMESPDGHVRAFDAQARGSMFGDGAAVVVLKPLDDALRDGDHVWSVVRGSAMNNDGALKVGYTAPSVVGQSEVVADALADAGVTGEDLCYVEAHGTATELGDPIEVTALTRAFRGERRQYCPLGSVKTNVGHLDRAAGVTGLIKTSLALHEGVIPPTLHFTEPNPELDLENSPFYVVTEPTPWRPLPGRTPMAGVSSLGMGGTNAHVVLEQAPPRPVGADDAEGGDRYHVLPISARSAHAADEWCADLAAHLSEHPRTRLADMAFTLQVGRRTFEHRRVAVAESGAAAREALIGGTLKATEATQGRPVVFVFPDADDLSCGPDPAVAELYRHEPRFRSELEGCLAALPPTTEHPAAADTGAPLEWVTTGAGGSAAPGPAAFAVQYALARTLLAWGVRPQSVTGHGVGGYVAACLTGEMSVLDSLAALSGEAPARRDPATSGQPTRVSGGAEPVVIVFGSRPSPSVGSAAAGNGSAPAPVVVTVLPQVGDARPGGAALADCLAALWLGGVDIDWQAVHDPRHTDSPTRPDAELARPCRIPLPTYPFQRQEHWLEGPTRSPATVTAPGPDATMDLETIAAFPVLPEADWFFLPTWRRTAPATPPGPGPGSPGHWLVYTAAGRADDLLAAFRAAVPEARVTTVRPGGAFDADESGYTVRPGDLGDTMALFRALRAAGEPVERVVHLWSLDAPRDARLPTGLHSVVALARAAAELGHDDYVLDLVVAGTQQVWGDDVTDPFGAMLAGPCRVLPLEQPRVRTRLVDMDPRPDPRTVPTTVHELFTDPVDQVVAVRAGRRWVPGHDRVGRIPPDGAGSPIRRGGVYLLTGGLGGIARSIAVRLRRDHDARVVLLSRRPRPTRTEWPEELAGDAVAVVTGDVTDPQDVRRAVATAIERFGALHGVVHAAGLPGAGLMQLKRPQDVDAVLAPKVDGALALAEALAIGEPDEMPLDFIALFSSISSTTGGGPGQVDYCAANAFLDSYAASLTGPNRRVVSIDWGEWTWNGWEAGLDGYDERLRSFFRENRARIGIGSEEGWRALQDALASGEPRIVVCSQDFPTMVHWAPHFTVDVVSGGGPADRRAGGHPRPELVTPYREPADPDEEAVAGVWQNALGLNQVGADDNFFELGGNSLIGVDMIATLRREFPDTDLAPHALYETPTVATLTAAIRAQAAGGAVGRGDAGGSTTVRAQLRRSGVHASAERRRGR
ncbi:MAG: SDR family NAD(P)-dependent oxidoreductase [Kineosporiaceae bacterium]